MRWWAPPVLRVLILNNIPNDGVPQVHGFSYGNDFGDSGMIVVKAGETKDP